MAKRQREWAQRARIALLSRLGGYCVHCGEESLEKLVPNHIDPATRSWSTKGKNAADRINFYHKDEKAGLLEVACVDCNNALGNRNRKKTRDEVLRDFDRLIKERNNPVPF